MQAKLHISKVMTLFPVVYRLFDSSDKGRHKASASARETFHLRIDETASKLTSFRDADIVFIKREFCGHKDHDLC